MTNPPAMQPGAQTAAQTVPTNNTAVGTTPTGSHEWQLPSGAANMLPKDPLEGEDGYSAWSKLLQVGFQYAGITDVVNGMLTCPPSTDSMHATWMAKDAGAKTMILRSISASIIATINVSKSAHEIWEMLCKQLFRTTISSAVNWIAALVRPLPSIHNFDKHV